MAGGGAQLLESFIRFSLGEGQPGFGFSEVRGLFVRDAVAFFSRALLALSDELREFLDVRFCSGYVAAACGANGTGPIDSVQPVFASRRNRQSRSFFPAAEFERRSR